MLGNNLIIQSRSYAINFSLSLVHPTSQRYPRAPASNAISPLFKVFTPCLLDNYQEKIFYML